MRGLLSVIAVFAVGASTVPRQAAQAITVCGRVVAISCSGPSSPAGLLLISQADSSETRVVIPAEYRPLFGGRIEDRYEQRIVCLSTTAPLSTEGVQLTDPAQIKVVASNTITPLPPGVARTCDPDVRAPTLIEDVKPQYTFDAMRAKVSGRIVVRGIVDGEGVVRDVLVVQALEPSLDDAARDAFSRWRFLPATRHGAPVPMALTVEMSFVLR